MRAEHAARRRTAVVAIAVLACLGAAGGVGAAALERGMARSTTSASAIPAVTVTAEPASEPIVAPSVATGPAAPMVTVSPAFDLDARSIDDPSSIWVVVNKHRPLDPLTWAPPELEALGGGAEMTPQAGAALIEMRAAAADAGAGFSIGTAYRSHGFQSSLHADYVARWGSDRADTFSARAGYSEHQTGLAADIYQSDACRLKPCFGDEEAGVWVAQHGYEFGFITRYPEGAEDITGYRYEPWHVRYVGVDLATHLHDEGVTTLEDLFGLDPAPTYE